MTKEIIKDGMRYRVTGKAVEVHVVAPGRRPFWRRVSTNTFTYRWLIAAAAGAPRPYVPERTPSTGVLIDRFDEDNWQ